MEYSRTTKSGAKITFQRTVDEPATRAIKVVEDAKKKSKSKKKAKKGKETKLLSKPKAKGIAPISQSALLKGISQDRPLVREVEEKVIERDDRSLFFNREMAREKKKWLA